MTIDLRYGDCRDVLRGLDDNSVHAIVTDPPYGIEFVGRAWDKNVPDVDIWAECLRVLRPGGNLLAFGGTRTVHRTAIAIEDAGFEIRDQFAWLHSQGMPKGSAQLKPAHEPIVVARKVAPGPWLAIDQCKSRDRWPTNVVLAHDEHCAEQCSSGCVVAELDAQSVGTRAAKANRRIEKPAAPTPNAKTWGGGPLNGARPARGHTDDQGGAARFFPTFRYQAKAPTSERPSIDGQGWPTVKPLGLMRWLVRLVTPPGGLVLDPFAGTGPTLQAAELEGFDSLGIERDAHAYALACQRLGIEVVA